MTERFRASRQGPSSSTPVAGVERTARGFEPPAAVPASAMEAGAPVGRSGHDFGAVQPATDSAPSARQEGDVVQRLIFLRETRDLLVPNSYYTNAIPKGDGNYPLIRQLDQEDRATASIRDLYTKEETKAGLLGYLKQGLMLPDDIWTLSAVDAANGKVTGLVSQYAEARTLEALGQALDSHRKVLAVTQGQEFYGPDGVREGLALGLLPSDMIPEADDLAGSEGSNLKLDTDAQQRAWWGYACRLIALVKLDANYTKTKELTDNDGVGNLEAAVQALHDYYYNDNTKVMYDDTASSAGIYTDWGYSLKFAGPSSLENLPTRGFVLPAGSYIFDIKGHSVKTTIRRDIKRSIGKIATDDLDDYFTFDSDPDNYPDEEKDQPVYYVWGK